MALGGKPRQGWLGWACVALRPLLVAVAVNVACQLPTPLSAEPVLDRALSGLRLLQTSPSCTLVKIEFNFRIRYVSPVSYTHLTLPTNREV